MDKKTAAEILGVSEKTVSRYVASGRLAGCYVNGKTGRQLDFDSADVERLKDELTAPIAATPKPGQDQPGQPEPGQGRTALARLVPHGPQSDLTPLGGRFNGEIDKEAAARYAAVLDAVEAHRKPRAELSDKLLLTLPECQALTGLSRGVLRAAIDAGDLKAKQIGRAWRVKRSDLEAWIEKL
jgi:excisionase family DNA binding protein